MSTFYETFLFLCNSKQKTPSRVALDIGVSKTAVTRWKRGYSPTDANLQKIADYFDVTVQYLKSKEQQEIKKPLSENEERLNELYEMTKGLNKNEINALKAFCAGLRANHKQD